MTRTTRLLLPFALVLLASPAVAQTQYRFEVYTAAGIPLDKHFEIGFPQASPPIKVTQEWSPGARGGVRFGADAWRHWGTEFDYSYGGNATRILNFNGGTFSFPVHTHIFSYNLLWYPGGLDANKKVFPYITAGAGATWYLISQNTTNEALDAGLGKLRNQTKPVFNAGGGIRFRFNRYGFRIDARDYFANPPRFGLPKSSSNPAAVVFPAVGVFQNVEVSFGFVYYFKPTR